jgi:hypothetical protein
MGEVHVKREKPGKNGEILGKMGKTWEKLWVLPAKSKGKPSKVGSKLGLSMENMSKSISFKFWPLPSTIAR